MSFRLLLLKCIFVLGPQALSYSSGISNSTISENLELRHVIDLFLTPPPPRATGQVFVELLVFQCV